uniref:Putative transposase n=1 Tax=uncultured bacterium pMCBF6 TaxID=429581 RepID=F2Q670_9BACT|nr:putative transposase [uncultured bacterium pMCBF6]
MPTTQRVNTSMARVRYGRPIGCRSRSSTTIRSMTVWSICTCSSGAETGGGTPPTPCRMRDASWPSRSRVVLSGSRLAIRNATVLRAGIRSFCSLHTRATSRWNAAKLRFCLVRKRFCSSSRMIRSTDSGKRPLPLPPLDCPRAKSVTSPEPCRARRIRT